MGSSYDPDLMARLRAEDEHTSATTLLIRRLQERLDASRARIGALERASRSLVEAIEGGVALHIIGATRALRAVLEEVER